ncbi:MAG: tetratricopeptide repeat protein [Saprospiraceae bacterium]|nr:tetratricopeptide repeat protein [Saprospiraceae bacterium]
MNDNIIDLYLLDLLPEEEKASFETQLQNDEALRSEVIIQREALRDIEGIGRIELKSKLQSIHQEIKQDSTPASSSNTSIRSLFVKIAAAAIFVAVMGTIWLMNQTPSTEDLFAQNFEPYELSLTDRSSSDNTLTTIEEVYASGNYNEAILLLEKAIQQDNRLELMLGLGISYVKTDQSAKAITIFKQILKEDNFNYEDEAHWYLGLTYLKSNELKNARNHFNILATDSNRDHHKEAKKLLAQLK